MGSDNEFECVIEWPKKKVRVGQVWRFVMPQQKGDLRDPVATVVKPGEYSGSGPYWILDDGKGGEWAMYEGHIDKYWTLVRDVEEPTATELRIKVGLLYGYEELAWAERIDVTLARNDKGEWVNQNTLLWETGGDYGRRSLAMAVTRTMVNAFGVFDEDGNLRLHVPLAAPIYVEPKDSICVKQGALTISGEWAVEKATVAKLLPCDGGKGNSSPQRVRPRPGQRWSDGRHEYALIDSYSEELRIGTLFLARRDDGLRVTLEETALNGTTSVVWKYLSGPTKPETEREAVERVIRVETEYPAAGETKETWARLVQRAFAHAMHANEVTRANMLNLIKVDVAESMRAELRDLRGNDGAWSGVQ